MSPPTTSESPFAELPPPVSDPAPTTTSTDSSTTSTSTTIAPETVELGSWHWGARCRVPVAQVIAAQGPVLDRTFDLVVSDTERGVRLDFEDVETRSGPLSETELAEYLLETWAVLPSVLLDVRGHFIGFEDLGGAFRELDAGTSEPFGVTDVDAERLGPNVRSGSVGPWFDFRLGRGVLTMDDVVTIEERTIGEVPYPAEVAVSAAVFAGERRVEEFGEGAAWLSYVETGSDLESADGLGTVALVVESPSVLEVERMRPFESEVAITLYDTTDGRPNAPYRNAGFRHVFETTFDWENAEGCE